MTTWYLCDASDRIVRTVEADDLREAQHALHWRPGAGGYVTSKASYNLGWVRPLPPNRCLSCGLREQEGGRPYCASCTNRLSAESKRKRMAREAGVAERNALRLREHRKRKKQEKGIREGVERRRSKREKGGLTIKRRVA